ncbi:MAG: hypothetical protein JXA77_17860 [Bacteroidales bacterium]|nr:hypothetical protein [Bacteroidales bacterium]MBN2818004.1 hypothetical protein [Bacteroidales bacterium]
MKTKVLLLAVFVLALYACDDLGEVSFETTISETMVADIVEPVGVTTNDLKSTLEGYSYYEVDTIDIAENKDLNKYLKKIKEIKVYDVKCKLNGIPEGETINELTIKAKEANWSYTLNNLTDNNAEISLENISGDDLLALGNELLNYEKLTVSIEGTSSYAPMTLSVSLDMKAKVKADVLK